MDIQKELFALGEEEYRLFQQKLTPGLSPDCFLGVRVPALRALEKRCRGSAEAEAFRAALPHKYYDENLLHSVMISNMRDKAGVMAALDAFLPYVDNWAVCDTLRPSVFRREKEGLYERIAGWIASDLPYVSRFGMDMLMTFYLDADFESDQLALPLTAKSDDYYVRMMQAWYYATALAKQWDDTLPYLTERRLPPWIHNKTITKARESFRVSPAHKELLLSLRIAER